MKLSKLLLIENNLDAAKLIIGILGPVGHDIVHKSTALEGLNIAQIEHFDGILVNYAMPDMPGLELCQALRAISRETPIISTSVNVDKLTAEDMMVITAFVPKPISLNLVKTVDKYVTTQSLSRKKQAGFLTSLYHAVFGDDDHEVDALV